MNLGKIMLAHGMATKSMEHVNNGIASLIKSTDIAVAVHGPDHPSLAKLYATIGKTCFKLKRREEALKYYNKAKDVVTKHPDDKSLTAVSKECLQVTSLLHRRSESMREASMADVARAAEAKQGER